jgi:hypothetical protein
MLWQRYYLASKQARYCYNLNDRSRATGTLISGKEGILLAETTT